MQPRAATPAAGPCHAPRARAPARLAGVPREGYAGWWNRSATASDGTTAMEFAQRIDRNLRQALDIHHLEVHDDSHQHHGHTGWREGGETHFRVLVVSSSYEGVSRVERQRMVNAALKAELGERVHALQMACRTPDEHAKLAG
jgi:BolA protein